MKRSSYSSEVFNETAIEVAESKKYLNITFALWGWPIHYAFYFDKVHFDFVFQHNDSKVLHFKHVKLAFLRFEIKFVFSKAFEYLANMLVVCIKIFVEYENVIKVDAWP